MGQRFLIDTNVVIHYSRDETPAHLRDQFDDLFRNSFNISVITKIEFLGWKKHDEETYKTAIEFLKDADVFPLDNKTIEKTIGLKRENNIKLPDAIIAATCLVYDLTLATRNEKDFKSIEGITIHNPFI